MDVTSLDQNTVSILPESLNMTQPKDMTLFTITSSVLQNASDPKTGLQMRIRIKLLYTNFDLFFPR